MPDEQSVGVEPDHVSGFGGGRRRDLAENWNAERLR